MTRLSQLMLVALLAACSSSGEVAHAPNDPTEPETPSSSAAALQEDLLRRICQEDCAGPFARITVFGDAEGRVRRVQFDGDLQVCSHPPRLFFDETGTQTLAVPERPVTSPEDAQRLAKAQAAQLEGLREIESARCPRD